MMSLDMFLFWMNFIAIDFSSIRDEYLLGIPSSIKLKIRPQDSCPKVDVEGFAEVSM